MRFRSLLAVAHIALLAGCASGGANINSRTYATENDQIKRLVVYYNAKSPHFTGALYDSFTSSTRRRLEACGLAVTPVEYDSLELDMKKKVEQTIAQSKSDAVLLVVRNGGNLVTGSGGVSGNLYFDTRALDKQGSKTLWQGRIDYRIVTRNMFADDKLSGERFAAQFVSRMATDKLITGCPPDVVTPKP